MCDRDSDWKLNCLLGQRLVAIGFLRDRVRLQFDDPIVDIYSHVYFRKDSKTTFANQAGWRDLLCGCIPQTVSSAYLDGDSDLVIEFKERGSIRISLRMKDRTKDHAVHLKLPDVYW
jgi:hypothetical protein